MSHGVSGVILQGGCRDHPLGHSVTRLVMDENGGPWRSKYGIWYQHPIVRVHECTCGTWDHRVDTVVPKPKAQVRPEIVQAIRRLKDAKHIFPWEVEWLPKSRASASI